jgi:HNH endonuclease
MSVYVARSTKKLVIERAASRCEYCHVPAFLSSFDYHIEHIIGLQHGGPNSLNNLAYCCSPCNWKKGPNISTVLEFGGQIIPLFNPRIQNWFDHFDVQRGELIALSDVAQATIKLLELNVHAKIEERFEMMLAGLYP